MTVLNLAQEKVRVLTAAVESPPALPRCEENHDKPSLDFEWAVLAAAQDRWPFAGEFPNRNRGKKERSDSVLQVFEDRRSGLHADAVGAGSGCGAKSMGPRGVVGRLEHATGLQR